MLDGKCYRKEACGVAVYQVVCDQRGVANGAVQEESVQRRRAGRSADLSNARLPPRPSVFLHRLQGASGSLGDSPARHESWYRSPYLVAGFGESAIMLGRGGLLLWMAFSVVGRIRGKSCAFLAAHSHFSRFSLKFPDSSQVSQQEELSD